MGHPAREAIIRGEKPGGRNANIHKGNSYKLLQNKHHCFNAMHWYIDIYNLFCRHHVNHGLDKKCLKAFMRKCLLAKNIKSSGHSTRKKQIPTFPRLVICMRLAATDDLSHSGETAASGSNSPWAQTPDDILFSALTWHHLSWKGDLFDKGNNHFNPR